MTLPWKIVKSGEEPEEKGKSTKNASGLRISQREQAPSGFLTEGTGVMLFIGSSSRREWYLDAVVLF